MIGKGSKLYSIVSMKCPQCHEGAFFQGHPYNFSSMGLVRQNCQKCNLKYHMEPSFYYGSYYVVYSLGVALFVAIWVLQLLLFPSMGPGTLFVVILISLLVLSPLLYALSKIIWANLFFKYNKDAIHNKTSSMEQTKSQPKS